MWLHRLVRNLMIGSLALAAAAWWFKDELPPPAALSPELQDEPKQVRVERRPIETRVGGVDYRIQPRYRYDMSALVVSLHHSDSWWDYAHKEWGDNINLMDLCVVWGRNALSGAYQAISFSNNQWECSWSAGSKEAWDAFDQAEAANNHMVTDDPGVAKALRKIRIGDQIRVRGYLVDYTTFRNGVPAGTRVSSEVRTDTGNGACEVLYVESLETLAPASRAWRNAGLAALALFALSLLAWFFLPPKFED
jgi:hypothetical protein